MTNARSIHDFGGKLSEIISISELQEHDLPAAMNQLSTTLFKGLYELPPSLQVPFRLLKRCWLIDYTRNFVRLPVEPLSLLLPLRLSCLYFGVDYVRGYEIYVFNFTYKFGKMPTYIKIIIKHEKVIYE